MSDLTSELAMKEKHIIKLKDDNELLLRKISDNVVKQLETKANKVQ